MADEALDAVGAMPARLENQKCVGVPPWRLWAALAGLALLAGAPTLRGADAVLMAEDACGRAGAQVLVPIRLSGAPALGTLQFSVHWDASVATFLTIQPMDLPGVEHPENFGGDAAHGTLIISWDDPSVLGTVVSDGAGLFALRFWLTGAPGSSSTLRFDGVPVAIELTDPTLAVLTVAPVPGTLHILARPDVAYVDGAYAGLADCVQVDWPYTGSAGERVIGFDAFATLGEANVAVRPGGSVHVAGAASGGEAIELEGVTVVLDGAAAAGTDLIVGPGAVVGGDGAVGDLAIESGGTVSPGFSPGKILVENLTWAGGGIYVWEINAAEGTAGGDPGWDLIDASGMLTITSTSSNPFILRINSLTPSNVAGEVVGFDSHRSYAWRVASAAAGVDDFEAGRFQLDTSAFQNELGGGSFALVQSGHEVLLEYRPKAPIAVRLIRFEARWNIRGEVDLTWQTGVEFDLIGFIVERLQQDGAWGTVQAGVVPASGGGRPTDYALGDAEASRFGTGRYRLVELNWRGMKHQVAETVARSALAARSGRAVAVVELILQGAPFHELGLECASEAGGPWTCSRRFVLGGTGALILLESADGLETQRFFRLRQD